MVRGVCGLWCLWSVVSVVCCLWLGVCRLQPVVCLTSSVVFDLLYVVCYLSSVVRHPPSVVCYLSSSVINRRCVVCHPSFFICHRTSSVIRRPRLLSVICRLPSVICNLSSAFVIHCLSSVIHLLSSSVICCITSHTKACSVGRRRPPIGDGCRLDFRHSPGCLTDAAGTGRRLSGHPGHGSQHVPPASFWRSAQLHCWFSPVQWLRV